MARKSWARKCSINFELLDVEKWSTVSSFQWTQVHLLVILCVVNLIIYLIWCVSRDRHQWNDISPSSNEPIKLLIPCLSIIDFWHLVRHHDNISIAWLTCDSRPSSKIPFWRSRTLPFIYIHSFFIVQE